MDKYELTIRTDQLKKLIDQGDYASAAKVASSIEWKKVKNSRMLLLAADAYHEVGSLLQEKEILMMAYERMPMGRQIVYRLCLISVELGDLEDAEDYLSEFVTLAPADVSQFILRYSLFKAEKASLTEQIAPLETYVEADMDERWAAELAELYYLDGQKEKCIEVCDEVMLWYQQGEYFKKVAELKQLIAPLTPSQQELFEQELERELEGEAALEAKSVEDMHDAQEAEQPEENQEDTVFPVKEAYEQPKDADNQEEQVNDESDDLVVDISTNSSDLFRTMDLQETIAASMEELMKAEELKEEQSEAESMDAEGETASDTIQLEDVVTSSLPVDEIEIDELLSEIDNDVMNSQGSEYFGIQQSEEVSAEGGFEENSEEKQIDTIVDQVLFDEDVADVLQGNSFAEMKKEAEARAKEQEKQASVESLYEEFKKEETATEEYYYLSDEYKDVFKRYLRMNGVENQIANTMKNIVMEPNLDGSSAYNNVVITGEAKSGKTSLSLELLRAVNKERGKADRKAAKISSTVVNRKGLASSMPKLIGMDLVISDAGALSPDSVSEIFDLLHRYTADMIVILMDNKRAMDHLLQSQPHLDMMFNNRINLHEYDINEWVAVAKEYAKKNGYLIDEMGTLALYARIDSLYGLNRGLELNDVETIIDEAIEEAKSFSFVKLFRGEKRRGKYKILCEKDFEE